MRRPIKWNLIFDQGSTFRDMRRWSVGADAASAVPVDLSGCTARAQVRREVGSPDVLLSLTTENGGIELGKDPGRIDLYVSAADTTLFKEWDEGVWDFEIVFPNGDVRRLFFGAVRVTLEVTRD